jgi:hypothetical protein
LSAVAPPFVRCDGQNYIVLAHQYKSENRQISQKYRGFHRSLAFATCGEARADDVSPRRPRAFLARR